MLMNYEIYVEEVSGKWNCSVNSVKSGILEADIDSSSAVVRELVWKDTAFASREAALKEAKRQIDSHNIEV